MEDYGNAGNTNLNCQIIRQRTTSCRECNTQRNWAAPRDSEETVKHQTRNILRKFEATNVKDAFEALREHLYVFGKDELGVNYFYQNFERHLYLSEDRISAHVNETIVIEAIYRPMTEYISEHYVTNGKVENIHLDGEPFDVHERVGINTASTKRIDPALKPGEKITL